MITIQKPPYFFRNEVLLLAEVVSLDVSGDQAVPHPDDLTKEFIQQGRCQIDLLKDPVRYCNSAEVCRIIIQSNKAPTGEADLVRTERCRCPAAGGTRRRYIAPMPEQVRSIYTAC
jgi:hypothetical protein